MADDTVSTLAEALYRAVTLLDRLSDEIVALRETVAELDHQKVSRAELLQLLREREES